MAAGPSTLLPATVRQALRRCRLLTNGASTHGGVGERRSRSKGEGLEFEDFRPYAFGDDMGRLPPHVYARLGQPVMRQYNVAERLAVTLLVDLTASMAFGSPAKADVGKAIVVGMALCALANGDAVRCGALGDAGLEWFPRLSGAGRLEELEGWLASRPVGGGQDLGAAVTAARPMLPAGGLCVLVSDMWTEDLDAVLDVMAEAGQDLVLVRVLTPEELAPSARSTGPVRLTDSETGEEVEVELGPQAVASYLEHLRSRTASLRERVLAHRGRFVDVSTEVPISDVFERHMRAAQVVA